MDQIILVIDGVDVLDRLAGDLERTGYAVSRAAVVLSGRPQESHPSLSGSDAGSASRLTSDPHFISIVRGLLAPDSVQMAHASIPPHQLASTVRHILDKGVDQRGNHRSSVIFLQHSGAT